MTHVGPTAARLQMKEVLHSREGLPQCFTSSCVTIMRNREYSFPLGVYGVLMKYVYRPVRLLTFCVGLVHEYRKLVMVFYWRRGWMMSRSAQ